MKFAAFVLAEAKIVGKDKALIQSMPFDEQDLCASNTTFLFENMPSIINQRVILKEDQAIDEIPQGRQVADNAVPGKPIILFHSAIPG